MERNKRKRSGRELKIREGREREGKVMIEKGRESTKEDGLEWMGRDLR